MLTQPLATVAATKLQASFSISLKDIEEYCGTILPSLLAYLESRYCTTNPISRRNASLFVSSITLSTSRLLISAAAAPNDAGSTNKGFARHKTDSYSTSNSTHPGCRPKIPTSTESKVLVASKISGISMVRFLPPWRAKIFAEESEIFDPTSTIFVEPEPLIGHITATGCTCARHGIFLNFDILNFLVISPSSTNATSPSACTSKSRAK